MESNIEAVTTKDAPAAIGPYSQAVLCGGWVFCSGQVGMDPKTSALVDGGVADEARQALKNLSAVMESAGGGLEDVARCTVYLKDMDDFATVNEVYAEFFGDPPPSRACVEVSRLPKDARVEIDAVGKVGHKHHVTR